MSIGTEIKYYRQMRGLTQKELGEKCGMADSAIRRYESDRGNPTDKTLKRIAQALDISVAELQGYEVFDTPEDFEAALRDARNKAKEEGGTEKAKAHKADGTKEISVVSRPSAKVRTRIDTALGKLNSKGHLVAAERIEELTKIPDYQIENPDLKRDGVTGNDGNDAP